MTNNEQNPIGRGWAEAGLTVGAIFVGETTKMAMRMTKKAGRMALEGAGQAVALPVLAVQVGQDILRSLDSPQLGIRRKAEHIPGTLDAAQQDVRKILAERPGDTKALTEKVDAFGSTLSKVNISVEDGVRFGDTKAGIASPRFIKQNAVNELASLLGEQSLPQAVVVEQIARVVEAAGLIQGEEMAFPPELAHTQADDYPLFDPERLALDKLMERQGLSRGRPELTTVDQAERNRLISEGAERLGFTAPRETETFTV